jgi:hypothetical protein
VFVCKRCAEEMGINFEEKNDWRYVDWISNGW